MSGSADSSKAWFLRSSEQRLRAPRQATSISTRETDMSFAARMGQIAPSLSRKVTAEADSTPARAWMSWIWGHAETFPTPEHVKHAAHVALDQNFSTIPADGVYFVKFASSAACAACLTCSGVGEIGFAGAEIDDVHALSAEPIGFGGHLQCR